MALNLNTNPYYDDFDATKKFNRVLFKPGFAVQARELTQLQTIFENQLNNFGKHLFVDGAPVLGCKSVVKKRDFIKIDDLDASSAAVSNDTLDDYIGDTVTGGTSGIIATIDAVATGLDSEVVDKKTLYISYTQGDSTGANVHFLTGETLTVTSSDSGRNGDTFVVDTNTSVDPTQNYFGKGLFFTIDDGVIFANGRFVVHDSQEVNLEKYKLTANYYVGVTITDSIVTASDDTTLLDPATGTFNFNAPGADRYKVSTTIGKLAIGATNDANFISLYSVVDGVLSTSIAEQDLDIYGLIGDRIAQRTFDESGHYTIKNFSVSVREHYNSGTNGGYLSASDGGSTSHIAVGVGDGIAMVRGRKRIFNAPTYLKVEKGNTTKVGEGFTTSTVYGNYVLVNNVAGEWDVDGGGIVQLGAEPLDANMSNTGILTVTSIGAADGLRRAGTYTISANEWTVSPSGGSAATFAVTVNSSGAASVEIIEGGTGFTVADTITIPDQRLGNGGAADLTFDVGTIGSSRGSTFGSVAAPSTVIGQARVRQFRRESGTPGAPSATYRLYLYDIKMTAGRFSDVRSVYFDSSISNFNGAGDAVLENGLAVLKETNINRMVFQAPITATKTLATDTGGTYDNTYTYQKEYSISFASDGTGTITTSGTESFPYSTTPSQTQLDDEFIMILQEAVTIDGTAYAAGEIFDIQVANVTSAGASSISFDLGTTLSTGPDVKIYVKVKQTDVAPVPFVVKSGRYVKINTATNEGGATGPWNLGICNAYKLEEVYVDGSAYSVSGTEYGSQFKLENGQKDNYYGHSKLYKKPSATISTTSKYIVVKISYLDPNYAGSNGTYFAVDSYPADELTNPTPTFYTYEIPVFAASNGRTYKLRDSIDFRPFINNTATDTTSLGSATENPSELFELRSIGGQEYPIPTESYTTDAEYYMGRIDKILMSETGSIFSVSGTPKVTPAVPKEPPGNMLLATVKIPPYPSISPKVGRDVGRKDLACVVNLRQNRRFTMQDVGALEKRLARLEYYTSLNFLEMNTTDKVIQDANGLDRFKNGFFVNTFANHDLSNGSDPDYNFGVDPVMKYGSTNFYNENVDVIFDSVNSTYITKTGNLLTLPYTHTKFTENVYASKFRNCVGELLFQYIGDMDIYPPSDNFVNVEDGGERNIEQDDMANAIDSIFESLGDLGLINGVEYLTTELPDQIESVVASGGDVSQETIDTVMGWWWSQEISLTTEFNFEVAYNQYVSMQQLAAQNSVVGVDTGEHSLVKDSFGDVITGISFAPFMRSQIITVVTTRLKPNTKYYAFFDNDDINVHCKQVPTAAWNAAITAGIDNYWSSVFDNTNDFGDALVSDTNGNLVVQFRIPESTFRNGSRLFRLCDDQFNRDDFVTSAANASFESNGLVAVSTELTLSTQIPNIAFNTTLSDPEVIGEFVTDVRVDDPKVSASLDVSADVTNTVQPLPQDPLAQTFKINNNRGIFVTKADVYFRNKSSTNGITCQIREVVNGFPGSSIMPYGSKYKDAADVNISVTAGDGTVTFNATTFEFDSPIYLKPNREYCICLLPQGNDPSYEAWVSELGQNKVGTTERILATDVTSGILFSSSNNAAWNPHQAEDLKFAIYRADFDISSSSVAKLTNSNIDYLQLEDFTSGFFKAGDQIHGFDITLSDGGSGYAVNDIITLNSFGNGTGLKIKVLSETSGVIDSTLGVGFEINDMGSGFDSDPSGVVTQLSATGSGSGAEFTITTKLGLVERFAGLYNVARIAVTKETFSASDKVSNGTSDADIVSIENKVYNKIRPNIGQIELPNTGIAYTYAGTESTGVSTKGTDYRTLTSGETTVSPVQYSVYSYSNEDASLSNDKSLNINATFTSNNSLVSPVIDLARCSTITTVNRVNDDSTDENGRYGGNATCKYISKIIRLDEENIAEDLRVYLDERTPTNASIKVYGKFLSPEDDANFREDLYWLELTKVAEPAGPKGVSYIENEYKIPNKDSNDLGLDDDGVFEYDVSRVDSVTVTGGGSGYTSAPTVTFSGGGAYKQAQGIAQISAGAVTNIILTDPGRGYTGAPTIALTGGGGSSATATATIDTVTYEKYSQFAIKIVLLAANTSNVPAVKNLRAIALQA